MADSLYDVLSGEHISRLKLKNRTLHGEKKQLVKENEQLQFAKDRAEQDIFQLKQYLRMIETNVSTLQNERQQVASVFRSLSGEPTIKNPSIVELAERVKSQTDFLDQILNDGLLYQIIDLSSKIANLFQSIKELKASFQGVSKDRATFGELTTHGPITVENGGIEIKGGDLTFQGESGVNGVLNVSGNLNVSQSINVGGGIDISSGTLDVKEDVNIRGKLIVNGKDIEDVLQQILNRFQQT